MRSGGEKQNPNFRTLSKTRTMDYYVMGHEMYVRRARLSTRLVLYTSEIKEMPKNCAKISKINETPKSSMTSMYFESSNLQGNGVGQKRREIKKRGAGGHRVPYLPPPPTTLPAGNPERI